MVVHSTGYAMTQLLEEVSDETTPSSNAVTADLLKSIYKACNSLPEQCLVKPDNFTLADAMSAVNILDPKMDVGMLNKYRRLIDINQAVASKQIKLTGFTQAELLNIMDRSIAMLVLWLQGEPPQLTILSNVYLQNIDLVEDTMLRKFFQLYLHVAQACRRVLLAANAFDNEDFQPQVVTSASSKLLKFLPSLSEQVRSFWEAGVCNDGGLADENETKTVETVFNSAIEAAFSNLKAIDKRQAKSNGPAYSTTSMFSGDDEYTLANGIISRLRLLNYWYQSMLLRHLTGDPGYGVNSPAELWRTCESLLCTLEVIADSVDVIEQCEKNMPSAKHHHHDFDLSSDDRRREEKSISSIFQRGQQVMGFDYLLNLECMDYPRCTFPELPVTDAYRYIEQSFLHLLYCSRQLLLHNIDNCRVSMDCALEVLQRLTSDGSTLIINPYAAIDSVRIHRGNENDDEDEYDDEEEFSSSRTQRRTWNAGKNETVFDAFKAQNNKFDDQLSSSSSCHHVNLNASECRPNTLVRSVLVLQTVALATRFSPTPEQQQASWLASARDTLTNFCFVPALFQRDPFICNELSLMPYPRGPQRMSVWKFLDVYFDTRDQQLMELPAADAIAEIRLEYELLLQPLIDGASNIIKERIRICGMNKAVQREACLRLAPEIAVYEARAKHVDARFQALFEDIADKLTLMLVSKPLLPTTLSPSSSNSNKGGSKRHATTAPHNSASANRPSLEQLTTLRRTFDYIQLDTLTAWFSHHLSDVLAQASTLSLELGLLSSSSGSKAELEYVYWYQAEYVLRQKLRALSQARMALQHNKRTYCENSKTFTVQHAKTVNYAKIVSNMFALLPTPESAAAAAAARVPTVKSKNSTKSGRHTTSKTTNENAAASAATAAEELRAQKAAAEVAVRNEHLVLTMFAQRRVAEIEKNTAIMCNFLERQLQQTRLIAHVCTAFTFTLRLLKLWNENVSGVSMGNHQNAEQRRIDVEYLTFYNKLFPFNLPQEMFSAYRCSFEQFVKSAENNMIGVENDEKSAQQRPKQPIQFYLATLPSLFERIERELEAGIPAIVPASSFDGAVVAASPTTKLHHQRVSFAGDAADDKQQPKFLQEEKSIVNLYYDALRSTLSKICRHNRSVLSTLTEAGISQSSTQLVQFDFHECAVFPILK